jgi:hypothetical protein
MPYPPSSFISWDGTVYWRLVGKVGDPPSPTIAPFAVGTLEVPAFLQTGLVGVGSANLIAIGSPNEWGQSAQASFNVSASQESASAQQYVGSPGPVVESSRQLYLWGDGQATSYDQATVYSGKTAVNREVRNYGPGEALSAELAAVSQGMAQVTSEAKVENWTDGFDDIWRLRSTGGQLTGGYLYCQVVSNGVSLPWDADAAAAQSALQVFDPSVIVTGGPLNDAPFEITFPKKLRLLTTYDGSLEGDAVVIERTHVQLGFVDAFAINTLKANVQGNEAYLGLSAVKDRSTLAAWATTINLEAVTIDLWAQALTLNGLPIGASASPSHWEPLVIGSGPMPTAFPDPASATAEDVATAINALLAAPQLVYADGDVVMVEVF